MIFKEKCVVFQDKRAVAFSRNKFRVWGACLAAGSQYFEARVWNKIIL
jgi:hypothetical protein